KYAEGERSARWIPSPPLEERVRERRQSSAPTPSGVVSARTRITTTWLPDVEWAASSPLPYPPKGERVPVRVHVERAWRNADIMGGHTAARSVHASILALFAPLWSARIIFMAAISVVLSLAFSAFGASESGEDWPHFLGSR